MEGMEATTIVLRDDEVECDLFTAREGVLSPVGHDLRLHAPRSTWTLDPAARTLDARIDAAAIVVASAREGDRDAPQALSEHDRHKIETSMRDEVLRVARHPEVRVRATWTRDGDRAVVEGDLTIVGVTRPFRAEAARDGDRWRASHTVDQTAFGIRPFTALLGALKVRRDVVVRVSLPAARLEGSV